MAAELETRWPHVGARPAAFHEITRRAIAGLANRSAASRISSVTDDPTISPEGPRRRLLRNKDHASSVIVNCSSVNLKREMRRYALPNRVRQFGVVDAEPPGRIVATASPALSDGLSGERGACHCRNRRRIKATLLSLLSPVLEPQPARWFSEQRGQHTGRGRAGPRSMVSRERRPPGPHGAGYSSRAFEGQLPSSP